MFDDKSITQKEKLEVMANDRKVSTYFHHAQADPELSPGGRFAKVIPSSVVGASPVSYPAQPTNSPWACDPVPNEPFIDGTGEGNRLGYRIDGDPEPIQTSSSAKTAASVEAEGGTGVRPSTLKRRV